MGRLCTVSGIGEGVSVIVCVRVGVCERVCERVDLVEGGKWVVCVGEEGV
jgi:hypothetical protein